MSSPVSNNLYAASNGISSTDCFITEFMPRDPTSSDSLYPLKKRWLNTSTFKEFILTSFSSTSTALLANWVKLNPTAPPPTTGFVQSLGANSYSPMGPGPVLPDVDGNIVISGNGINTTTIGFTADNSIQISLILPNGDFGPIYLSGSGDSLDTVNPNASEGKVLTGHGNMAAPTYETPAALSLNVIQVTHSMSPYTYTPSAKLVFAEVEVCGGGGSGASTDSGTDSTHFSIGGGGGAGEYRKSIITVASIGSSKIVTIGSGGSSGVSPSNGGLTSFGSLLTAAGGISLSTASSNSGIALVSSGASDSDSNGVTGSNGSVIVSGSPGNSAWGIYNASGTVMNSGSGGSSIFGSGGSSLSLIDSSSSNGVDGKAFGSGGSGAITGLSSTPGFTGGSGSAGVCIIKEYIVS